MWEEKDHYEALAGLLHLLIVQEKDVVMLLIT